MFLCSMKNATRISLLSVLALCMTPAMAHVDASHVATGLGAGFSHPLSGLDHVLAMLAIGLWAAQNKRPALWVLPIVFPVVMTLGAMIGASGMQLAGIELGVASSVAVLGLLIACAVKLPVWAGVALVSLFALAHGFAHGAELPHGAPGLLYGVGFIAATFMLHLLGLLVALIADEKLAGKVTRVAGTGIAAIGVYLVAGLA